MSNPPNPSDRPRPPSRTGTPSYTPIHSTPNLNSPSPQPDGRNVGAWGPPNQRSSNRSSSTGAEHRAGSPAHEARRTSFSKRLSASFAELTQPQKSNRARPPQSSRMASSNGTSRPPQPSVTLSSLSKAAESSGDGPPPARPSTPPLPDLIPTATYMPGDGDFFGEAWAGTSPVTNQKNKDERFAASIPNIISPDGGQVKSGSKNSFSPQTQRPPTAPAESPGRAETRRDRAGSAGEADRRRSKRPPSQKAMLAKALEKANHAVLLDNAQNYEQAMAAYYDACNLLGQVMMRTNGEEDKGKLEAIRSTYKLRINELKSNEHANPTPTSATEKALPDVPRTGHNSLEGSMSKSDEEALDTVAEELGPSQGSDIDTTRLHPRTASRERLPPRRQSLSPQSMPLGGEQGRRKSPEPKPPAVEEPLAPASPRKPSVPESSATKPSADTRNLSIPMKDKYAPAPLSPRKFADPLASPPAEPPPAQPAPDQPAEDSSAQAQTTPTQSSQGQSAPAQTSSISTAVSDTAPKLPDTLRLGQIRTNTGHVRTNTTGSTSWLDTIGEDAGSSSSSTKSRDSADDPRHGHIRQGSRTTEAEFDSALDAAIEAAYDEGFEPMSDEDFFEEPQEPLTMADTLEQISDARRNVDRAKKAVREAEREAAITMAKQRERQRRLDPTYQSGSGMAGYDDIDADEEERLLDAMTKDYIMEDPTKAKALPRQPDSTQFSQQMGSFGSLPTIGTPLSTVNEREASPKPAQGKKPVLPPLSTSLSHGQKPTLKVPAPLPISTQLPPDASGTIASPGVRERRLSGQNVGPLKIDTSARLGQGMQGPRTQPLDGSDGAPKSNDAPKSASLLRDHLAAPGQPPPRTQSAPRTTSPHSGPSPSEPLSGTRDAPGVVKDLPQDGRGGTPASPGRPARVGLRKNFSSSSLKSAKSMDDLPSTPLGRVFSHNRSKDNIPNMPDLPAGGQNKLGRTLTTASMSFFDNDIHSPDAPGSPNPFYANAPMPLEPCPEVMTLRPFWLMRAIYQTISHPRGGYISKRLFIPRDVWRVKNVKLRNVDDKVAQLDLLTAGLMNLAKVDMLDADSVLEVMQSFELLLDQVQSTLGKKLGNEVGMQSSMSLFKGSPIVDDHGIFPDPMSAKDKNSKSYLSGWRKLRNKNSIGPGATLGVSKDGTAKEALAMKSLPMTPLMNVKFAKRDPTKILGIGPHAHYMAALARLCDAVQVIDQIARQVEDPGLKLSSKAHVGLELSTKHAAEFFGFYVCRFALSDIGMMLDKFIKRGTEWVMG